VKCQKDIAIEDNWKFKIILEILMLSEWVISCTWTCTLKVFLKRTAIHLTCRWSWQRGWSYRTWWDASIL